MRLPLIVFLPLCATSLFAGVTPGRFVRAEKGDGFVIIHSDNSAIRLTSYAPGILRVDFLTGGPSHADSSFAVIRHPDNELNIKVSETDSVISILTTGVGVQCTKHPIRLSFGDAEGTTLLEEPPGGGLSAEGDARKVRFLLHPADHFYGTGERGTSLDKRGQAFDCYNVQVGGYAAPLPTMNVNVPLLATPNGFALFIDNTYPGRFDLGVADTSVFSYSAGGGDLSYYVLTGSSMPAQLEKYTWLTGREPLPPRWVFGYMQSKNRYGSEREARGIVRTLREKRFPCDAVVLDLQWFAQMGDVAWNDSLWPNHEGMVTDFLSQGIKTVLITEPYIVEYSKNFREADSLRYLATHPAGDTYYLENWWSCGGCTAGLLDLTNPAAQRWWWSKHSAAFGGNIAGIWTDLGEPERHPADMAHFLGGTAKVHNIFNLLWARTVFDGMNTLHPDRRVMNLTRSGFAGIQRYGVLTWSGDVARNFGGLAVQTTMMLNMGMSGIAYHCSDIGGYARMPTTPELYVRWLEYGVFCPITRAHGAGESVHGYPTEPWQFGAEAESICRRYIQLRYRLLPYNYSLARENYDSGIPLARPLFWVDPTDPLLLNEGGSFMWGNAFLVSPVVAAGDTSKELRFPRGIWYDYWTDERIEGGRRLTVSAGLDRLPLFVSAGSIIPMAPVMRYSDERPLDSLIVEIFPSDSIATSASVYEDDGITLGYQRGECARTLIACTSSRIYGDAPGSVTIGATEGDFQGKIGERTYILDIHHVLREPHGVRSNGTILKAASATDASVKKQDGFWYERNDHRLWVRLRCNTGKTYRIDID